MKTVVENIIEAINEVKERNIELTHKGILAVLENALYHEKDQIIDAFNKGMEYGRSPLQTFDYPASRYYMCTYTKEKDNINENNMGKSPSD